MHDGTSELSISDFQLMIEKERPGNSKFDALNQSVIDVVDDEISFTLSA